MEFKKEDWLVPSLVKTPDIENDIKQYLGNEVLGKWEKTSDKDIKATIVFITERLDFISHLNAFREHAINDSKLKYSTDSNGIQWLSYEFHMNGHDYSGVQFDIEALVLYLLLTCIDAIQSQPQYLSAFSWLQEKAGDYENLSKEQIIELLKEDKKQHDELYGLSKNFRLAFTDEISEKLRNLITENIIVASFNGNDANKDSFSSWASKTQNEKICKIAKNLYELRSKYTHKNIRYFIPKYPFGTRPLNGTHLLCKKNFSLENILIEVLKELCLKKLSKR